MTDLDTLWVRAVTESIVDLEEYILETTPGYWDEDTDDTPEPRAIACGDGPLLADFLMKNLEGVGLLIKRDTPT